MLITPLRFDFKTDPNYFVLSTGDNNDLNTMAVEIMKWKKCLLVDTQFEILPNQGPLEMTRLISLKCFQCARKEERDETEVRWKKRCHVQISFLIPSLFSLTEIKRNFLVGS